jgi:hypothetical protein
MQGFLLHQQAAQLRQALIHSGSSGTGVGRKSLHSIYAPELTPAVSDPTRER